NAIRHPLNRYGQAQDIANLAEFLLSPKSSWITGQIHKIDGGLSTLKK
ncbi:MAG: SDR family oxidoreductase, partial [Bacteroidia bacterium]|nr:SDR family oxidoreductase [Bacteroidia bacterium]